MTLVQPRQHLKGLNYAQGSKELSKNLAVNLYVHDVNIPPCHSVTASVPRPSFNILVT